MEGTTICFMSTNDQLILRLFTESKGKVGAGKGAAANPDRPVDISRLDIRVGCIVSVEKVPIAMNT